MAPAASAAPAARATRGRRWLSLLLCALPVLVVAALAYDRRWISDDGLINVRVLQNLFAGHGPVFNVGERVEVGTSTLWLAVLAAGHAVTPSLDIGRLAVWAGLLCTVAALVVVSAAAARLARLHGERGLVVPLGTVVLAALPPFWDFATSGLEMGLAFLWLATSAWLLALRLERVRGRPGDLPPAWRPLLPAVVIGLGPLVRPDLTVVAAVLGLALLAQSRRSILSALGGGAVALAVPVAYEVFRAGYYGALVPNTALAKGAGESQLSSGLTYLDDFAGTYRLWLPLLLVALVLAAGRLARRDLALTALTVAPVLGGVLHAAFVVRVGGDFMHGRLLLPATFCVLMPWAVVVVDRARARRTVAVVAVVAVWAVLVGAFVRVPYEGRVSPQGTADERGVYVDGVVAGAPGRDNPTSIDDYVSDAVGSWYSYADDARDRVALRERVLVADGRVYPAARDHGVVVRFGNIGIFGVRAGADVFVADRLSLADPIGARLTLAPQPDSRIGHSQEVPLAWHVARHAAPALDDTSDVRAARSALGCGDLRRLDEAVTAPLTVDRFVENLRSSWRLTRLHIPEDPVEARELFCG